MKYTKLYNGVCIGCTLSILHNKLKTNFEKHIHVVNIQEMYYMNPAVIIYSLTKAEHSIAF